MTTNQTAPVTDEELDQMIWKLERDGMTPKQLSLMKELREVRRAKGEPVAWVRYCSDGTIDGPLMNYQIEDCRKSTWTPLYIAPQAPVVPCPYPCGWDNLNKYAIQDAAFVARGLVEGEEVTEAHRQAVIANNDRLLRVIASCRDAMKSSGNSEQLEPVSNRDEFSTNSFTDAELEMMAHGDNPQANACRELLAFRRNSPATTDVWIPVRERMPENMDTVITSNGFDIGHGWWDGDTWQEWSYHDAVPGDVTHWMPIPKPPKDDL